MRRILSACLLVPGLLLEGGSAAASDRSPLDILADRDALAGVESSPFRSICSESVVPGFKRCFAKIVVGDDGIFVPASTPQGYGAQDLQSAYLLPANGGNGSLIAAVDAYDYPNAEADLAVYRQQYGLPPCTTANGCFQKVDENGGTELPDLDPEGGCSAGWSGETSLDLQMLSASCPDCRILLVEASAPDQSLRTAVTTAAKLGAVAISNSYGGPENANGSDREAESVYTRAGVLITASAGDNGFGAAYPASSAGVVAVGGTTLKKSASSRGWAESAWKGSGSGCSAEIAKPTWQTDPSCPNRMEADIAAIGNPATGVAVYCTDPGETGTGGWGVVGGTSVSAPLIAGAFTVLKVPRDPSFPWTHPALFNDVTTGSNGSCATPYFCTAETGYDGPTGWGTPNGALIGQTILENAPNAGGDAGEVEDAGAGRGNPAVAAGSEAEGDGDAAAAVSANGGGGAVAEAGSGPSSDDAGSTSLYGAGSNNGAGPGPSGFETTASAGGCAMAGARSGGAPAGDGVAPGLGLLIALGTRRRRAPKASPAR